MVFERHREIEDFYQACLRYTEAVKVFLKVKDEYDEVWATFTAQRKQSHREMSFQFHQNDLLFHQAMKQWRADHNQLMKEIDALKLSEFKASIAFVPFVTSLSMDDIHHFNRRRLQLEWIAVLIHRIAARNVTKMMDESGESYGDVAALPEKTYPSPQTAFASILGAFTNRIFKKHTVLVASSHNSAAQEGVSVSWYKDGKLGTAPAETSSRKGKLRCIKCSTAIVTTSTPYDKLFLSLIADYQVAVLRFQDFLRKHGTKVAHKLVIPLLRIVSVVIEKETEAAATLSALAIALARCPLQFPFALVLIIPKGVCQKEWTAAFEGKRQMMHTSFIVPDEVELCGAQNDSYDWVRQGVLPIDRLQRMMISMHTLNTIHSGSYVFSPEGRVRYLRNVKYLRLNTRILMGDPKSPFPGKGTFRTKCLVMTGPPVAGRTIMEIAATCAKLGYRCCAVNAASSYHCGGGTLTGGRHALEESWCIQSTLLMSLINAQVPGLEASNPDSKGQGYVALLHSENPEIAKDDLHMHIPEFGCIASPKVEIFRESAMSGYRYFDTPVMLQGVASIASYNKNKKMRDCPVDMPSNPDKYHEGMRRKFDAAVRAALRMKAEVLVAPDVGCGVYYNQPEEVGKIFGEVLKESYGCFKLIVITGLPEFADAVEKAASFPRGAFFTSPPTQNGLSDTGLVEQTLDLLPKSPPLKNDDFMNDGPPPRNEIPANTTEKYSS